MQYYPLVKIKAKTITDKHCARVLEVKVDSEWLSTYSSAAVIYIRVYMFHVWQNIGAYTIIQCYSHYIDFKAQMQKL